MDVVNAKEAIIVEKAGAVTVMALERAPLDTLILEYKTML